jgi:phage/plasmid-associated DNA primase
MSKLIRQKLQLRNTANANGVMDDGGEGDEGGAGGEIIKKIKTLQKRIDIIVDIIQRLSKTNDKKNIMTEAKELFFDPVFLEKLDQNPYLLCFRNGVIDFKERRFRRGLPEDYLSKCTNIDYIPIDPVKQSKILEEIHDFMNKLFPIQELRKYMWDHLASTLIGNNMNQTFNMYIGIGQNGKSVLVNLMEHVLGDYKSDVPLSLLTQQRTRIGGLAPELVQLKGVRYAVLMRVL